MATNPRKSAASKVTSLPSEPKFSDSTLEIFHQVLATQQINVGDPTFLEVAEKVIKARTELNAAMKARGLLED